MIKESQKKLPIMARLVLVNIFLAFSLIVLIIDMVLTKETSHITSSLAITLITAVTAIVTNWCLSIARRLFRRSDFQKSEDRQ